MTLYDFNKLDLSDRMEAVNQQGVFIDNHVTELERCNLYAINKFFIEVVYNPVTNTITEIRSFKTGEGLNKYSADFSKGI